ncbi:MAG TPA: NAD(P)H-hydrate epimerase [Candidatus Saccharimonadales bacterium]|nr:NAD(P)H-hydrate epimerase [Candidatus Saccharimonadales bacterium]
MTEGIDSPDALGQLTSEQVARLDAAALECGVTTLQLMELAGWQVARCAWRHLGNRPNDIGVVAGHGNNGGDGLVAARHLATWGCSVQAVVVAEESRVRGVVLDHVAAARACGVDVRIATDPEAIAVVAGAALLIDAVLGTGLRSAPRDPQARAIRVLNCAGRPILSVDVPSGLDATSGEAFDPCVRATLTCTLTGMKRGLQSSGASAYAGAVWVADIGMPAAAWKRAGLIQPPGVKGGQLVHTSS